MVAVVHGDDVAWGWAAFAVELHDRNYFSWAGNGHVWARLGAAQHFSERGGCECGELYHLSTSISRAGFFGDGDGGVGDAGGAFVVAVADPTAGWTGGLAECARRGAAAGVDGFRSGVGRGGTRERLCDGGHLWCGV